MSENQITRYSNFDKIADNFKSARNGLIKAENKLNEYVTQETKQEKLQLETAIKSYQTKVKTVLETEQSKKLKDKIGGYSKEVSKNLGKAQKEFITIREEIMKKNWTEQKKNEQVQEVYHHILTKLIDPKEMEDFKKNMSNMVVMIVPEGMSGDNFQYIDN